VPNAEAKLRLDVLLAELAQARDDDRYAQGQFSTLISVALAMFLALATLFYSTCAQGYPGCTGGDVKAVPIWIYLCAPMLPMFLVSYATTLAAQSTLRSYYMRVIELAIHELTDQTGDPLPVPSWSHVMLEVTGQGRAGRQAANLWYLMYAILFVVVLAILSAALVKMPEWRYRVSGGVIDSLLLGIPLAVGWIANVGGADLWKRAAQGLKDRLDRTSKGFPSRRVPNERAFGSFLLLPRNQEELYLKALFIPLTFLIARVMIPGLPTFDRAMFIHLAIFLIVFELFVYQARYLLNDVRDRHIDGAKPLGKRRFPFSRADTPGALRLAFCTFVARLVLALLVIACAFPWNATRFASHAAFLAAIFAISLPYEYTRSRCNAAMRNRRDGAARAWTIAIVAVVGFGYALRTIVGLWLAGVSDIKVFMLMGLGTSLLGSAFVALTWALESTRAPESDLVDKAHLVLFRQVILRRARVSRQPVNASVRVLEGAQTVLSPWNVATILATAGLSAAIAYILQGHPGVPSARWCHWHYCLSFTWVTPVLLLAVPLSWVGVTAPVRVGGALSGAAVVVYWLALQQLSIPGLQGAFGAVLVTMPLLVAVSFRRMRFADLTDFAAQSAESLGGASAAVMAWFARNR